MKLLISETQYKSLKLFIINEQRGGHNKSNTENFIEKSQNVYKNPDGSPMYDYSLVDYEDSKTKIKIICPKHREQQLELTGQEYFEVTPSKHAAGQARCPFENKRNEPKHSDEHLAKMAQNVKSTAEFKDKYFSEFNAAIKRNEKNPGFYKSITKHFESLKRESYGEKKVAKILDEMNIPYKREHIFISCTNMKKGKSCRELPFDFYLPELNTCIEYDGEQHFKESNLYGPEKFLSTQANDKLKDKYCIENGIKLIRLHYKLKDLKDELVISLDSPEKFIKRGPY